jgi:hypothetical protein
MGRAGLLTLALGATLLAAAAFASGAYSPHALQASGRTPPPGFVGPPGIVLGKTACSGNVYFEHQGAFVVCDDDVWQYEARDPPHAGFILDTEEGPEAAAHADPVSVDTDTDTSSDAERASEVSDPKDLDQPVAESPGAL